MVDPLVLGQIFAGLAGLWALGFMFGCSIAWLRRLRDAA